MMSATPTTFWRISCRLRGFQPIQVYTGAEALEAVAAEKPGLILLDLFLPDIDGFELCDRLKRLQRDEPDPDRDGHRPA